MTTIMKKVNNNYQYQKMNEKKKEYQISIEETKEKYDALAVDANLMLNKKIMMKKNYIRLFYLELK